MKKTFVAAIVLACAVCAAAEEQWLQYRTARDPGRSGISVLWIPLNGDASAVPLPEGIKSEPRFARWTTPLAPEGFVRVAVFSAAGRGLYDRALVDTNVDGRLSDETVLVPGRSMSGRLVFESIKVVFPGQDGAVTYHLNLMLSGRGEKPSLAASAGCWYEGGVNLGGREYLCRLIDYNANAAFDDAAGSGPRADSIGIGLPSGKDYSQMSLGKYVSVAGALYEVRPARDGACVEFAEAKDVPMGTLVVPDGMTKLTIAGALGQLSLTLSSGRCNVPAGAWRVLGWRIDKNDKKVAWTLSGGAGPQAKEFTVPAGGEAKLEAGEPVTGVLSVTRSGRSYTFQQSLAGNFGEPVQLLRAGGLPPKPKVRIRNARESYDRTFSFSYG